MVEKEMCQKTTIALNNSIEYGNLIYDESNTEKARNANKKTFNRVIVSLVIYIVCMFIIVPIYWKTVSSNGESLTESILLSIPLMLLIIVMNGVLFDRGLDAKPW